MATFNDIINTALQVFKRPNNIPMTYENAAKQQTAFKFTDVVKYEQQIYRVKTDASIFRSAITNAENPTLRNRYELLRTYQNVALDHTLNGLLRQRLSGVYQREIKFVNSDNEVVEVDILQESWFRKTIDLIYESIFWGYSFIQLNDIVEGKLTGVELIPRQNCSPDYDTIMPVAQTDPKSGVSIQEENISKWVIPVYKEKHYLGEFIHIAMLVLMKAGAEFDWSTFVEVYGQPLMLAKTSSRDDVTRQSVAQALSNMSKRSYVVVDSNVDIQPVDRAGRGASSHKDLVEYLNEELAKAVLGQTLTSMSQTGGTEALGKIHNSILDSIVDNDIFYILNQFNTKVLPRLIEHKVVPEGIKLVIEKKPTVNKLEQLQIIKGLKDMGMNVNPDYIEQTFGIPIIESQVEVQE
jgi:phage gp29-like protein